MVRMLREKAEMGDPKAMSDLGATYFQGDELPRDHSTAFAWFERSATAGYTLAFVNLATCYREGLGCPKDERKALECYKVVAEVETLVTLSNAFSLGNKSCFYIAQTCQ